MALFDDTVTIFIIRQLEIDTSIQLVFQTGTKSGGQAIITHNHPDGIKGAEAVAVAVFLAKSGMKKEKIRSYISENYYEMNGSLDD